MLLQSQDAVLNQQAQMQKRAGNFSESISIYNDILTRVSDNSDVYYNLAKVYSAMGSSNEALSNYMRSLHIDLIDAIQGFGVQIFDIIKNYPIENTSDPKANLFRVDFANTMANIGKMVSGSYSTGNFLQPASVVTLDYNNQQNLNSFPDNHHIKKGINYALKIINWDKIYSNNKNVISEYSDGGSGGVADKVKGWFR